MTGTPRQLPIVRIAHKSFYRDDRLKQYRNTENPHEFYSFEEMQTVLKLLDVGGQLMKNITADAEMLGMIVQGGQSSSGEDVIHLITPDRELITVVRNFEPDEEILEGIIGDED